MLERINTTEVENRYKKATNDFAAFKTLATTAITDYENTWYYQSWYLPKDSDKDEDLHPRAKNVKDAKEIINRATSAAALADALMDYVDGDNNHFSWAWFCPLIYNISDAVAEYSYPALQSIDADLTLCVKTEGTKDVNLFSDLQKEPLTSSVLSLDPSVSQPLQPPGPVSAKKEALDNNSVALHKLLKSAKDKNKELEQQIANQQATIDEQQETIDDQQATIDEQQSLIISLRDIISELLIQISSFNEAARSVISAFGDTLAQIGEYFNFKSAREIAQHGALSHSEELSTPEKQEKNWQTALPIWLNFTGTQLVDQFEAAEEELGEAVYTANASTTLLNDPNIFNPIMTFEYFDYKQSMEDELTQQVEQTEEISQRYQQLELENKQLRRELEQAKLELAQQPISTDAANTTNVPLAPPPPAAPPPPPAPLATANAAPRFFSKKKKDDGDITLPKPDFSGPLVAASTTTPHPPAQVDKADFKTELNSRVQSRLTKKGVKYTPEKKQQPGTFLEESLKDRFRAVYGQSPVKPSDSSPNIQGKINLDCTF